ncbi:RadC family protein [Thiohalorhabdus sp.]|uniref:RadC family protein n=1 Tax=Thiohalorhabdus sp. TaxID=3094134 RepID=UPI002FC39C2F
MGTLFVKESHGHYRPAVTGEIVEAARQELADRIQAGQSIASALEAQDYVHLQIGHRDREVFAAMFLDARHRVLAFEELFYGTIDGSEVHAREIVKRALHHNAARCIVAHNHPSGVAEPSMADHKLTDTIRQALDLVEVRLLDHFVVGGGETVSFARRGHL